MKNLRIIAPTLLTLLLLTSPSFAQMADKPVHSDLPSSVASARCRYTPADTDCITLTESGSETASGNDNATPAQLPHQFPGPRRPMRRSPMVYPRPHPSMWTPSGSGRHAVIGAVIGFGIGAALGARGSTGARASLTFGVLGGMLGAVFASMTPPYARNPYRHGPWPDDEDQLASNFAPAKSRSPKEVSRPQTSTPTAAPPQSADGLDAPLALSAETP